MMFDNIAAPLKTIKYDINVLTPQRITVPAHTHTHKCKPKKTTTKTNHPTKQANRKILWYQTELGT